MFKSIVVLVIALIGQNIYAQVYDWGRSDGTIGHDFGVDVKTDGNGHVYVLSLFKDEAFLSNVVIEKRDLEGTLIWSREFGGVVDEGVSFLAKDLAVDDSGNVYLYGQFSDTVDFDPGAGEYPLISNGLRDCFVQKLNADGDFVWAKSFGGSWHEAAGAITLDRWGNLYCCGYYSNEVDFDPGDGEALMTADELRDGFLLKLDTAGDYHWVRGYGSGGVVTPEGLVVDDEGAVYTVGRFTGSVDADPGLESFELVSNGAEDCFVQKIDSLGNFLWAKSYGGWLNDFARSIAYRSDAVYITGGFRDTVDFDPGAIGETELVAYSEGFYLTDAFVQKLSGDGTFLWARSFGHLNNEHGNAVVTDSLGAVYITGNCGHNVDFDPGAGVEVIDAELIDSYVQKLDAEGDFVWAKAGWSWGVGGSSGGKGIVLDEEGAVYSVGDYSLMVDLDPGDDDDLFTCIGVRDVFVQKLIQCNVLEFVDSANACDWFLWEEDGVTYDTDTTVWVNHTAVNGCDSLRGLELTVGYSSSDVFEVEECGAYWWAVDGMTYTSDTIVSYTHLNNEGCDSTVMLELIVNESTEGVDEVEACDSYVWMDGIEYTEDNFEATYVLENSLGCDSVVTLNLEINTVETGVETAGSTLIAVEDDGLYQWLNCDDGMAVLSGEVNQEFTATENGVYAVEITVDGCTDTSECYRVDNVGLGVDEWEEKLVTLYPNPTKGWVMFNWQMNVSCARIDVVDMTGKTVVTIEGGNQLIDGIDLSHLSTGLYRVNLWLMDGFFSDTILLTK